MVLLFAALAIVYYKGMFSWHMAGYAVYGCTLVAFALTCIRAAEDREKTLLRTVSCFLFLFAAPVFSGEDYFGSLQMYAAIPGILFLLAAVIKKRGKWILPAALVSGLVQAWLPVTKETADSYAGVRIDDALQAADLILFVLLFLPCLYPAAVFLKEYRSFCANVGKRIILWWAGEAALLLPLVLGIGRGNVVFALLYFHLTALMAWLAVGEERISRAAISCASKLQALGPAGLLLLIYPVLLQPLGQFPISRISGQLLRCFLEIGGR